MLQRLLVKNKNNKSGRGLARFPWTQNPGSVLDLTGTSGPAVVFVTAAALPLGLVVTVKLARFKGNIRWCYFKVKSQPLLSVCKFHYFSFYYFIEMLRWTENGAQRITILYYRALVHKYPGFNSIFLCRYCFHCLLSTSCPISITL